MLQNLNISFKKAVLTPGVGIWLIIRINKRIPVIIKIFFLTAGIENGLINFFFCLIFGVPPFFVYR